jgi:cytochrome P450
MISAIISSFSISDIYSLLIIVIVIYVTNYYYHYFTRPNPLPGPFPLPILGNVHLKIGLEYNDFLMLMYKKYGDMFEIHFPGQRLIVLCRSDLIEKLFIPSTKTIYPFRALITEGAIEYGVNESGIADNIDHKSWKFHRQFFTQTMMTPSFNHQAIEWTIELWKEMESYWNNLGEDRELDLIKWMHRFTNDIIFKISTGVKNNAVASYYHTLVTENFASLNEEDKQKIKESENFIQSIETYGSGILYFFLFNKFIRHYAPFIRGKVDSLLKNKEYFFGRMYKIIKERRAEIENTPLDQPLRHDMLTSFITANTPRDINSTKHTDADSLRPMTDKEIFGNIFDAMRGGTDTVSKIFF